VVDFFDYRYDGKRTNSEWIITNMLDRRTNLNQFRRMVAATHPTTAASGGNTVMRNGRS
jgi:hypothetical protein